jgi:thioredoxin-like negative regulator of GroEL
MNDTLSQLSQTYGNRVDIQRVDIENPMSESLVEQFKIGPIPTVVFVAPNGQVKSTIIGESTATNYEAALRAISR